MRKRVGDDKVRQASGEPGEHVGLVGFYSE